MPEDSAGTIWPPHSSVAAMPYCERIASRLGLRVALTGALTSEGGRVCLGEHVARTGYGTAGAGSANSAA
jgi:hypothetical protein